MPRGGARAGRTAAKYANRTDLPGSSVGPNGQVIQPGKPLPIAAAPGQPYGAAGAQIAAQKAIPMAPQQVAGASPTPPAAGAPGGGPNSAPPTLGLPPGAIEPGELPPLHAPTDRPDEHVMTGVDAGPGAGSAILGLPPQTQGVGQMQTGAFLAHLASQPGAPAEMVALAQMAQRRG